MASRNHSVDARPPIDLTSTRELDSLCRVLPVLVDRVLALHDMDFETDTRRDVTRKVRNGHPFMATFTTSRSLSMERNWGLLIPTVRTLVTRSMTLAAFLPTWSAVQSKAC